MYFAQLAAFLTAHHHAHWLPLLAADNHLFLIAQKWAVHHGFVFQP